MQKRTILAMLAGLAIAAPIVGAQQQAAAKPAAMSGQQKAKPATAAKADTGKAAGMKDSTKAGKKKAKRQKKTS